jgi:ketosteroid isomerase-like protein
VAEVATPRGDPADHVALRDLVERYARAVDSGDIETVVGLFAEDGVLLSHLLPGTEETPFERSGHDQLRRGLQRGLSQYRVTTHLIGGQVIDDISGDDATGTTSCLAHQVYATDQGEERVIVLAIRYEDRYRRLHGGWRFAERRLRLQWSDDRPLSARR